MPRKMPPGLQEFLARPDKRAISRSTLQIQVENAKPARSFYFATAGIVIDGIAYEPMLRGTTQVRTSLTRAADQTTCEIQNVDTLTGIVFLSIIRSLFSAQVKIGRYFADLESGAEWHLPLLSGVVVGVSLNENTANLTAVSDPYSNIPAGAARRVVPSCQWIYKDPATCGSTSSEPTCNFLLTHSGGCVNRHSGTVNRAKFGGFAYLNSQNRLTIL